jgi:hypothetical protein
VTTPTDGRVELRQTTSNIVALPIFFGVVLVAIVVRQFFPSPNPVVLGVCGGFAVLDLLFAAYLLRNIGSTLVVTLDTITFTKKLPAPPQVIQRTAGTTLTFRTAANGPMGSKYTGYTLKLHDNATGAEVPADMFGRRRVQDACEALGWTFS